MAANVIDKLHHEHANMRRILILVRLQLDLLERQGMPDFVLLTNALYYMRKFPSIVHHPKEDFIFGKLLAADASVKQEVDRMRRQHEEIYVLEDRLINLVLEVQAGKRELCSRLLELGRLYLKTQAEHVETEERVLFPRALRVLKQKDWKEVRNKSSSIEDPLFGKQVTERYRYLYDYLLHEAADQGLPLSGTSQDPESSSAKISFSR